MNIQEVINRYQGKTLGFPDGQYVGECLSLVKHYIRDYFGIAPPASGVNAAYGYWTNFPNPLGTKFNKVPNTPTGVPKPGDIMIWNSKTGAGYGHIAIVIDANVNSFRSLDQNWGGKQAHIVTHNYTNVYGWLTPKEIQMETALTPEQVDQIYLIFRGTLPNAQERVGRTTSIYKDFGAEVKGTREFLQKEIQRLANENAVLTQRMKDLDGVVVGLEVKVKDLEKQIKDHKCPVVSEKEVARNIALRAWDRIKEWANSFFKS